MHHFDHSAQSSPLHHFEHSAQSSPLHHFEHSAQSSPHLEHSTLHHFERQSPSSPKLPNNREHSAPSSTRSPTDTGKDNIQLILEHILDRLSVGTSNHDEVPGQ